MKRIFLCDDAEILKRVYRSVDRVYTKNDIIESPEFFRDTEAIFSTWGMPHFEREEIKALLPSLKAVFYGAGTVRGFAEEFLDCGVRVFSAWVANAIPVAEFTVSEIILAGKDFFQKARLMREDPDESYRRRNDCGGNYGGRVGIVGCGMIGSLVAEKLRDYDLEVAVYDPFLKKERADELGVVQMSLEELFKTSKVVSNHLADKEGTKGIFGYRHFTSLPYGATFINTGRGAQVVEEELARALKERSDITAVLDVTTIEPLPSSHPFYALENCFLTPHIAGSLGNEVERMGEYMLSEAERFFEGGECIWEVNKKMLETMA